MGSWGTDLWDKRGVFENHTQSGIDFLDKSAAFMKDRIRIEQEYAKSLRRLVKQYQFKKKDEQLPFTYLNTFKRFLDHNDEFATQRENIAEEMNTKILNEMTQLSATSKNERKKALATLTTYKEEMIEQHKALGNTKRKFDQASEEATIALRAYENAQEGLNFTKAQVNKLQKTSHDKGMQAEKARETYKTTLDNHNGKRTLYYEVDFANLVTKELQEPEEKRLNLLSGFWTEYAEIQKRSGESALKVFEGIVEAAKSCDPAKDSLSLIERNRSGVPHPGDLPFEEYNVHPRVASNGTKTTKRKNSKAVAPKHAEVNDFSYLPQAQRRERITEMIASLQKQLNELEKSIQENPGKKGEKATQAQTEEVERIKQMINQYQFLLPGVDSPTGSIEHFPPSPTTPTESMPVPPIYEELMPDPPTGPLPPPPDDVADSGVPPPPPPPPPPHAVTGVSYRVLYAFEGNQDFELSINVGEEVTEVERDDGSGWSKVRKGAHEGYVPTSYIQRM